jgi:hypothetical protein
LQRFRALGIFELKIKGETMKRKLNLQLTKLKQSASAVATSRLSDWLGNTMNLNSIYVMYFGNVFNKFRVCEFRFIKNVARITFEAYRKIRWEYDTRKVEKIPTTFGAEWIRYTRNHGWLLFMPQKNKTETAIIELLDRHREINIGRVNVSAYNSAIIQNLIPLVESGFPLTEDIIEYAITGKPNE